MSDWIEIARKPEPGDTVKFKVLHGLMMREGLGVIGEQTPYGARIKARLSQFWAMDAEFDVPLEWITVVVSKADIIAHMREALKLISVQDQGLGGNATPAQCWIAAQRIACETLAQIPESKSHD